MILIFAFLGLLYGLVRGGRIKNITSSRFHYWPLIILAAFCEYLSAQPGLERLLRGSISIVLLLLAFLRYGSALAFLLANRRRSGSWLLLAGTGMNGLVILANKGRMPLIFAQTPDEASLAKIAAVPNYFLAAGSEPFLFLADRIVFFNYMFSLGDFLLAAGVFLLAASLPVSSDLEGAQG